MTMLHNVHCHGNAIIMDIIITMVLIKWIQIAHDIKKIKNSDKNHVNRSKI